MSNQIKNPKGLFVEAAPTALVSVATAQRLRASVLPTMPAEQREAHAKALDALEALPIVASHFYLSEADEGFDPAHHQRHLAEKAKRGYVNKQFGSAASYGWHRIGSTKGASNHSTETKCASAKEAGWLDVGAVASVVGLLDEMLAKVPGAEALGGAYLLQGAQTAAKRGRELTFEPMQALNQFAECESFLLFLGGHGYLDDKGAAGPLSRARGFESAAAAARTAKSRRHASWKVVKATLAVAEAVETPGDTHFDEVAGALAHAENKALDRALESAGVERLRARLAELEAEQGEAAAEPAAKKTRL